MARKKNAGTAPEAGTLLLDLEPEPPAAPSPPKPAPRPLPPVQAPVAAGPVPEPATAVAPTPAEMPTPVHPKGAEPDSGTRARARAAVTLAVKDNYWSASGLIVCPDGELLDSFELSGVVTADGVDYPGWLLAACEAMRWCLAYGKPLAVELGIPDHFAVGFLYLRLPARVQMATWCEETRKKPWPALYQEFIDLKDQVHPRIWWTYRPPNRTID